VILGPWAVTTVFCLKSCRGTRMADHRPLAHCHGLGAAAQGKMAQERLRELQLCKNGGSRQHFQGMEDLATGRRDRRDPEWSADGAQARVPSTGKLQ
jgi:hypothetical protein